MEAPLFAEAVARICARDRRYAPEAFLFLHEGLLQVIKEVQEREHKPRQVSGAELADGLRRHALALATPALGEGQGFGHAGPNPKAQKESQGHGRHDEPPPRCLCPHHG